MKQKAKRITHHTEQNNLTHKNIPIPLSDIISIIIAFISFLGICFSAWSVYQMKEDRRSAYKPDILINPSEQKISWDENGLEEWVQTSNTEIPIVENEDGSFSSSIKIQSILNASFDIFPIANIGVGSAKNILISWDSGNTQRLLNKLIEYNPEYSNFCTIGDKAVAFSFYNQIVHVNNVIDYYYTYMLPSNEKDSELSISLPLPYSIIIHELIKQADYSFDENSTSPSLFLTLTYEDILGNQYHELIALFITRSLYSSSSDGSGYAILKLIPSYGKK